MTKLGSVVVGLGCLIGAGWVVMACEPADPYGDRPQVNVDNATPSAAECKAGAGSAKPIEGKDPKGFKECTGTVEGAKGRCVVKTELGPFSSQFEKGSCADASEACVPEKVIQEGSKIELKTCQAVTNVEGRCFWPLANEIVSNYKLLKDATKDQCDPDQVCAPCVHPLTKARTGVCDLGGSGAACGDDKKASGEGGTTGGGLACPQVEPILDTASMKEEDCGKNMLCVDVALVGDNAKSLKKCATGVCAPKKSVERGGNYVPKTCRSLNGAEGRCANVGLPDVAAQATSLPKDVCDEDERCAPCFDPRDGTETAACHQASCDKPAEPAKKFAECCGGRARCVPTSAVPADSTDMLATDTCGGDTPICAPNELIPLPGVTPKKCSQPLGLLAGICVSKCAIELSVEGIIKGDCADDELCVPCRFLPDGTEACGK